MLQTYNRWCWCFFVSTRLATKLPHIGRTPISIGRDQATDRHEAAAWSPTSPAGDNAAPEKLHHFTICSSVGAGAGKVVTGCLAFCRATVKAVRIACQYGCF